jgi:hypothetical protein
MYILRKYGVATTINIPLIDSATDDLNTTATFAAGDVLVKKDEAASGNIGTLPTHEGEGTYSFPLTATEMQAARIVVTLIDQTATKVWRDQTVIIDTYGHASAQHEFDLDVATQNVNVSTITNNAITDAAIDTGVDTYQVKVNLLIDTLGLADRYSVAFFKNGQPVVAGITVPTIQVWKMADGTDLIASTALTQAGATGTYRYTASGAERVTLGAAYMAKITATIDGASRTWLQPTGRDS